MAGSVGALVNGLIRIFIGSFQDKVGFSLIYKIILVIELVLCLFITSIVQTNGWLYTIWVCMGYLCLGAHFVMVPIAMTSIFGLKSAGQLASMTYVSRALSAIVSTILADSLSARLGEDSYRAMFYISCGLVLISASVNIFCFKEEPLRKEEAELELPLISKEKTNEEKKSNSIHRFD